MEQALVCVRTVGKEGQNSAIDKIFVCFKTF